MLCFTECGFKANFTLKLTSFLQLFSSGGRTKKTTMLWLFSWLFEKKLCFPVFWLFSEDFVSVIESSQEFVTPTLLLQMHSRQSEAKRRDEHELCARSDREAMVSLKADDDDDEWSYKIKRWIKEMNCSAVSLFQGLSTLLRRRLHSETGVSDWVRREIVHHSNEPHNIHHNFYDANIYLQPGESGGRSECSLNLFSDIKFFLPSCTRRRERRSLLEFIFPSNFNALGDFYGESSKFIDRMLLPCRSLRFVHVYS